MSNVIAGVVRNQMPHLEEHIAQKKAIYMRYKEGLKDLPVQMNPYDEKNSEPNFWLSCMIIDKDAMCKQVRGEQEALYVGEHGKSCPTEILEAIASTQINHIKKGTLWYSYKCIILLFDTLHTNP